MTKKWGSELSDAELAPGSSGPGFDTPMVTRDGFDLARDPDEEIEAHPTPKPDLSGPLKTRLLKLEATEYGAGAAGMLAFLNLMGLFDMSHRPMDSLIGQDPQMFIAAQVIAAAVAAGLGLLILSRHGLWACEVVLLWSLAELIPWETRWLYGHGLSGVREWGLALSIVGPALLGVRGAWALRRARKAAKAVPKP